MVGGKPGSRDRFGFPVAATDGDLGDQFFELFGRIVVLAAANERLVELVLGAIEGAGPKGLVLRPALPTRNAVESAKEALKTLASKQINYPEIRAAIASAQEFMAGVERVIELRNGYIHSAWLVDERRPFADNFERRPEFLALRLSIKKTAPGLLQHDPRNLEELRSDLRLFAEINTVGRSALDAWRQIPPDRR